VADMTCPKLDLIEYDYRPFRTGVGGYLSLLVATFAWVHDWVCLYEFVDDNACSDAGMFAAALISNSPRQIERMYAASANARRGVLPSKCQPSSAECARCYVCSAVEQA